MSVLPESSPADLLAERLAAQVTELALGTNLFVGPVRSPGTGVEALAVFVAVGSGTLARHFGTSATRFPVVQVRVRGAGEGGVQAGLSLVRACLAALDNWTPNTGGYLLAQAIQPEPVSIGFDPSGNPAWTFNVQLTWSG